MKTSLVCIGILLTLTGAGRAQTVALPDGGKKGDPTVVTPGGGPGGNLGVERNAVDNAKTLAKGGNVAGVELAVSAINVAKKNSAEWYLETAQRLMQTAEDLAREGKGEQVTALANRAVQNLVQAAVVAKDAPTRAAAKTLAGFIQERYLADPAAAILSYEAAAQLAPVDAKGAQEASERLKKSDDNQKNKTPDKQKEKIDHGDDGVGGHG